MSDGSVSATMTSKDITDAQNPKTYTFTYGYSFALTGTNQSGKERLYPGDQVEINISLSYQGVDPKILSGNAGMYAGAFGNYPSDNLIMISNPGGSGSKTIKVTIPVGVKVGAENSIKIHCEGGYQPIEFAYIYEWVETTAVDSGMDTKTNGGTGTSKNTGDSGNGTGGDLETSGNSPTEAPPETNNVDDKENNMNDNEATAEQIDSGATIESVTGAVEISFDPEEQEWNRVKPGTKVMVGSPGPARTLGKMG